MSSDDTSLPSPYEKPVLVILLLLIGAVVFFFMLPSVGSRGPGKRSMCRNNLKQIGLALHNYLETYGSFPPASVYDEQGKPLHSWRALVLPFMEYGGAAQTAEYDFDEAWNGPHNSKLAKLPYNGLRCPAAPGRRTSPLTSYLAIVGPDGQWPAIPPGGAPHGDSRLVLFEVANSKTGWAEPVDITIDEALQMLQQDWPEPHPPGANVLYADSSVDFLSREELRALLLQMRDEVRASER